LARALAARLTKNHVYGYSFLSVKFRSNAFPKIPKLAGALGLIRAGNPTLDPPGWSVRARMTFEPL
jgi:hypothetical protein